MKTDAWNTKNYTHLHGLQLWQPWNEGAVVQICCFPAADCILLSVSVLAYMLLFCRTGCHFFSLKCWKLWRLSMLNVPIFFLLKWSKYCVINCPIKPIWIYITFRHPLLWLKLALPRLDKQNINAEPYPCIFKGHKRTLCRRYILYGDVNKVLLLHSNVGKISQKDNYSPFLYNMCSYPSIVSHLEPNLFVLHSSLNVLHFALVEKSGSFNVVFNFQNCLHWLSF